MVIAYGIILVAVWSKTLILVNLNYWTSCCVHTGHRFFTGMWWFLVLIILLCRFAVVHWQLKLFQFQYLIRIFNVFFLSFFFYRFVIQELIETERVYVRDLGGVVEVSDSCPSDITLRNAQCAMKIAQNLLLLHWKDNFSLRFLESFILDEKCPIFHLTSCILYRTVQLQLLIISAHHAIFRVICSIWKTIRFPMRWKERTRSCLGIFTRSMTGIESKISFCVTQ